MSSTYQTLKHLLILGRGYESFFHVSVQAVKSMQNCRPTILLPYQHHCTAPGTLAGPDCTPTLSISHRWFKTSSTNSGGIHLNCSLTGASSITFIVCSIEWVQPNSTGSNEKTLWYLAKSQWVASASSGAQESNPLKSSSSNSLPHLCLTVNLAVWGPCGSSPPPATGPP